MPHMVKLIRRILPEKMSFLETIFYMDGPVKSFLPQHNVIAEEVSKIGNGVLLDIGTGPGTVPLLLGKLLPAARIVGVDLNQRMVEIAQNKKNESGLSNVDFKIMDANALAFGDNTLDMIISIDSLHHWKRPEAVFEEMYRCLKPSGEAWIYDGFSGSSDEDIDTYAPGLGGWIFPHLTARLILSIHGFSQKEYETDIKNKVAKTRFRTFDCDKRGCMMRLRLRKR